jgi:UDP:flavonoid glycosyltransferase YjiC (YdhE family)
MDRLSAVVCHAGNNTVCEALARGVPLVVAPVRDDQPVIAEQVLKAGAGIRLRFGRVNAAGVGAAVGSVLDDPEYRAAAARLRAAFAAAGGVAAAAARIEQVLADPPAAMPGGPANGGSADPPDGGMVGTTAGRAAGPGFLLDRRS